MLNSQVISLKGRDNFKRISKIKTNMVSPFFVFVKSSSTENSLRLGIIATRKIGNAVLRNKIRRIVRESFRLFFKSNPASETDFVVILRKNSKFASNAKLRKDLELSLKKITKYENSN